MLKLLKIVFVNLQKMEETWRDAPGYEGLYEVSNLGRVKSLDRIFIDKKGRHLRFNGKVLKPSKDRHYYIVKLYNHEHEKTICRVHRLVALAFIPNPDNKPEVDHIDTNYLNNRADNLRWVTKKENANNLLTISKRVGKQSPNRKPVIQYTKDMQFIKKWDCIAEAAYALNIQDSNISSCCKGIKNHSTAGGFIWRYAS